MFDNKDGEQMMPDTTDSKTGGIKRINLIDDAALSLSDPEAAATWRALQRNNSEIPEPANLACIFTWAIGLLTAALLLWFAFS